MPDRLGSLILVLGKSINAARQISQLKAEVLRASARMAAA